MRTYNVSIEPLTKSMRVWKMFIMALCVVCLLETATLLYQQKQIHRLIERVTELDILQTIMGDWILHLNQQQSSQHNRI
jgi:hypothetical protein